MRTLAGDLGVDPMAIYHYMPNKEALLHAVVGRFLDDFELPEPEGGWKDQVEALCRAFRALGHRHRGGFLVYVLNEKWAENEVHINEAFYSVLRAAGFAKTETVFSAQLLMSYTETFTWGELTDWHGSYSPEERRDLEGALSDDRYPVTASLAGAMYNVTIEEEFDFGLKTVIAGLDAQRNGNGSGGAP